MPDIEITFLGTHWEWSGDLFYMTHPDDLEARVFVDSLGETWVDIRRRPERGAFHSERVEAFRSYGGAASAEQWLRDRGFENKRVATYASRVRERPF